MYNFHLCSCCIYLLTSFVFIIRYIDERNAQNLGYKLGLNYLADHSLDEILRRKGLGYRARDTKKENENLHTKEFIEGFDDPSYILMKDKIHGPVNGEKHPEVQKVRIYNLSYDPFSFFVISGLNRSLYVSGGNKGARAPSWKVTTFKDEVRKYGKF